MRIQLEPTPELVLVGGVTCRVWRGKTNLGTSILAIVSRIVVPPDISRAEFRELIPQGELAAHLGGEGPHG